MERNFLSGKHIRTCGTLFFLTALCVVLLKFSHPLTSHATTSTLSLHGYAWSDTIGWIDMNAVSADVSNTANPLKPLTGYGWSDTIGWIQFGGLASFPQATTSGNAAIYSTGNHLTGWARAVSGDTVFTPVTSYGTSTYATPGSTDFTVPQGVTSVTAVLKGAGGSPATTTGIAVTPGETLTLAVGANGSATTLQRGAAMLATGVGGGGGAVTFGASNYPTAANPNGVAAGDVNGDGKSDIVVSNYGAASFSVFLNNGNGTFAAKVDYPLSDYSSAISIADVNNDGKLDIVAADNGIAYQGTKISVLLGNGNGTFGARTDYTVGPGPTAISLTDINNDGYIDIITPDSNSGNGNSLSVLINNKNGTFAPRVAYTTATYPFFIATVDVNNDGYADIIAPRCSANFVSVFLNSGNGTFAAKVDYPGSACPAGVGVADINGDGKVDIVVTNASANTVSVFLGNGNGTFAAKVDYATGIGPNSILLTDVTGDGYPDVIADNYTAKTISILTNNRDGTFGAKTDYLSASNPSRVASGDFNGDGKTDLVATNLNPNTISVLLNTTPTTPGSATLTYSTLATTSPNGWDGFISLDCTNTNTCGTSAYSPSINGIGGLSGYAWGSDVIGWTSFAATTIDTCSGSGIYTCTATTSSAYANQWCENIVTTCTNGCDVPTGTCFSSVITPTGTFTLSPTQVRYSTPTSGTFTITNMTPRVCTITGGTDSFTYTNQPQNTPAAVTTSPLVGEVTYTLKCSDSLGTMVTIGTQKVKALPKVKEQ